MGRKFPRLLKDCRIVIRMISNLCTYTIEKLCSRCGMLYNDDIKHLFDCAAFENHRISFNITISTKFGNVLQDYVSSLNTFEHLGVLLGGPCIRLESLSQNDFDSFLESSILYLSKMWQYKEAS